MACCLWLSFVRFGVQIFDNTWHYWSRAEIPSPPWLCRWDSHWWVWDTHRTSSCPRPARPRHLFSIIKGTKQPFRTSSAGWVRAVQLQRSHPETRWDAWWIRHSTTEVGHHLLFHRPRGGDKIPNNTTRQIIKTSYLGPLWTKNSPWSFGSWHCHGTVNTILQGHRKRNCELYITNETSRARPQRGKPSSNQSN